MRKFAVLPRFEFSTCVIPTIFRTLLRTASVLIVSLALTSCANDPKVLASPQVLLQGLSVSANTQGDARILLHNFSNVPMTFTAMRGEFKLAGQFAAPISLDFSLEIPGESPENVAARLTLSPAALNFLNASKPLPYTLEGKITTIKPNRVFKFYYEGQLNPTPGVPGAWR